MQSAQHVDW